MVPPAGTDTAVTVELDWAEGGAEDLDLHVYVQATEGGDWQAINYRTIRSAQAGIGWLERDAIKAPGHEIIRVPETPSRLTVAVHRYSATGTFEGAHPHIRFLGGGQDLMVGFSDKDSDGAWWNVLDFRSQPPTVVVHGKVLNTEPDPSMEEL